MYQKASSGVVVGQNSSFHHTLLLTQKLLTDVLAFFSNEKKMQNFTLFSTAAQG